MQLDKSLIAILAVVSTAALADGHGQSRPQALSDTGQPSISTMTAVIGTVTDAGSNEPIRGVRVRISSASKTVASGVSDRVGNYKIRVPPGTYTASFETGDSQLTRSFVAKKNRAVRVNGKLAKQKGEVIIIRDRELSRRATAIDYKPLKTLPYSAKAANSNRWTKAWLLLDVDRSGTVSRVKFMHRPGLDLDEIAVNEAFKLRFNPSLNKAGQPIKTLVVWSFDWPSYWWLIDHTGVATAIPRFSSLQFATAGYPRTATSEPTRRSSYGEDQNPSAAAGTRSGFGTGFRTFASADGFSFPHRVPPSLADTVPCRGTQALNLDSISPTLRDCTVPDFEKPFDAEPWIGRAKR